MRRFYGDTEVASLSSSTGLATRVSRHASAGEPPQACHYPGGPPETLRRRVRVMGARGGQAGGRQHWRALLFVQLTHGHMSPKTSLPAKSGFLRNNTQGVEPRSFWPSPQTASLMGVVPALEGILDSGEEGRAGSRWGFSGKSLHECPRQSR